LGQLVPSSLDNLIVPKIAGIDSSKTARPRLHQYFGFKVAG